MKVVSSYKILNKRVLKYLTSGIGAFAVEYISFYCLYRFSATYLIVANAISFLLGLSTSFILNKTWTFNSKTFEHGTTRQFNMYVTLALINLVATLVLVEVFKSIGIKPEAGKLLAMVLTSIWNYIVFQRIIFKHQNPDF